MSEGRVVLGCRFRVPGEHDSRSWDRLGRVLSCSCSRSCSCSVLSCSWGQIDYEHEQEHEHDPEEQSPPHDMGSYSLRGEGPPRSLLRPLEPNTRNPEPPPSMRAHRHGVLCGVRRLDAALAGPRSGPHRRDRPNGHRCGRKRRPPARSARTVLLRCLAPQQGRLQADRTGVEKAGFGLQASGSGRPPLRPPSTAHRTPRPHLLRPIARDSRAIRPSRVPRIA